VIGRSDNFYRIEALALQTDGVPPSRRRREFQSFGQCDTDRGNIQTNPKSYVVQLSRQSRRKLRRNGALPNVQEVKSMAHEIRREGLGQYRKEKRSEICLFELHSIIGRSNPLFDPAEPRSAHIRAIYCTGSPG